MKEPFKPKSRATIHDVAREVGVSTKSISRVLNDEPGVSDETRQRILSAIERLGYIPNSAARRMRGSSRALGLVTSGFEDYAGEIMRGMSKAAQNLGYNLLLYVQHSPSEDLSPYHAFIGDGLIDGVLMVVPYDYEALIRLCNENGLPYVLVDYEGNLPVENAPIVTVTNRKGMLEATRYLVALGHRCIGFITGRMSMAGARERLQGYQDALREVEISYDSALVVEGDWTQETGFRQMRSLLARHPAMTAVLASDDLTAFGVMDAIKDAGLRVGEDISVIGFDNIPMASSVYPALTTVRQPMQEMGQAAAEILIGLLEGRPPINRNLEFATDLIIRQTTGKPPSARRA
jgi:LacI family transcriptional regulator